MSLNPYTGSLRGVSFGVGEDYLWSDSAPVGLGIPTPETDDLSRAGDGSVGGNDWLRNRIIRVPLVVLVDDNTAEDALDQLKRAWRPSQTTTELDLRLSADARRYYGRPRGLEVDITRVEQGLIVALGTFDALDPYAYGTTTTSVEADSSSPIVVSNSGNAATTRANLTITGNGGKPTLINTSDPHGGRIQFRSSLASGQTVNIHLRTFAITNSSGVRVDQLVSPVSDFFVIESGNNTISFTGCASVSAVVRPAYF